MPIFDLGYKPWAGEAAKGSRAWPIFRESLFYGLRTKWLKLLYAAAWAPCLVAAVVRYFQYSYFSTNESDQGIQRIIESVDARFYFEFQQAQFFIMAILAALVGPGLVAEDRRANALELYLSRPITRGDYLLGKVGALFCFLLSVTLAPNLLLWIVESSMSPEYKGFTENWSYPLRALGYDVLICTVSSLVVLAIASMTRSTGMGTTYWLILFFCSGILGSALYGLTGNRSLSVVSYIQTNSAICRAIFDMPATMRDPHWGSALFVLIGLAIGSLLLLWKRLRGTEVFR